MMIVMMTVMMMMVRMMTKKDDVDGEDDYDGDGDAMAIVTGTNLAPLKERCVSRTVLTRDNETCYVLFQHFKNSLQSVKECISS